MNYLDPKTYSTDIPYSAAHDAHRGTSWVPETRAANTITSHGNFMVEVYKELHAQATKGGTLGILDEEFERFRQGYKRHELAYLGSRSRMVSAMISGPSGYPAERMRKRGDVAHRRLEEVLAFSERAQNAIRRKLRPDLAPIMAGDADALDRLQAEIRAAKLNQERMKAANKALKAAGKQGKEAQAFALAALGFTAEQVQELVYPKFASYGQGFAHFSLSNNNANIRRMELRVKQITRLRGAEAKEVQTESGIKLVEAPAENRVKLFFPGKPAPEVIQQLKSNGFRWTPSQKCWQAYYNCLGRAKALAGVA